MSSRPNAKPVYIPNDLYKKLKIAAAFDDISLTKYIENILKGHIPNLKSLANDLENKGLDDGK